MAQEGIPLPKQGCPIQVGAALSADGGRGTSPCQAEWPAPRPRPSRPCLRRRARLPAPTPAVSPQAPGRRSIWRVAAQRTQAHARSVTARAVPVEQAGQDTVIPQGVALPQIAVHRDAAVTGGSRPPNQRLSLFQQAASFLLTPHLREVLGRDGLITRWQFDGQLERNCMQVRGGTQRPQPDGL
jgi:hypothetical protein